VRVRLDEATRGSLSRVQGAWLVGPEGEPIPMREMVSIEDSSTYASINRVDRQRAVTVTAAADAEASPEQFDPKVRRKVLEGGGCWTIPVVSRGRVFCRDPESALQCIDVVAPDADGDGGEKKGSF